MLLVFTTGCARRDRAYVLDDFEHTRKAWRGLERSTEQVRVGAYSGKWTNLQANTEIRLMDIPSDWSQYDRLTFWLYSQSEINRTVSVVCISENEEDLTGWDYYSGSLRVDWQGWKLLGLDLRYDIKPTRNPRGWDQIDAFVLRTSGDGADGGEATLYLDDMRLVKDPVSIQVCSRQENRTESGVDVCYVLVLENRSETAQTILLRGHRLPGWQQGSGSDPIAPDTCTAARGDARPPLETRQFGGRASSRAASGKTASAYRFAPLPEQLGPIAPGANMKVPVKLVASASRFESLPPLQREDFALEVRTVEQSRATPTRTIPLYAVTPLPKRVHPFLFGNRDIFVRAKDRASRLPWAKAQVDKIILKADKLLDEEVTVPTEPGQWHHHYVCKQCGTRLQHRDGKHICTVCGTEYEGWPYDQVIAARKHGSNWSAVQALGLAYVFSGDEAYARRAKRILLQYADRYAIMPLHDIHGVRDTRPGAARVFAQSLDEAIAVIGAAWGYDLIYPSPCLSNDDRREIEDRFLHEVAATLRGNTASRYNEWAWHNAAFAAIGYCLEDEALAAQALDRWSGLQYQLQHSVSSDGFWWEATFSYHYLALEAMRWTMEAAFFAGINLYGDSRYKAVFDAPLRCALPDGTLPALNDGYYEPVTRRHPLYEIAYSRFGDPTYVPILREGKRESLQALLWGVEQLPDASPKNTQSTDLPGLGAVVLRQGMGEDTAYALMDYGSHGGGHGHLDKLSIIYYARGQKCAVDPGTTMLGSQFHGSWYRQTIAHNTVVVDGKSQAPTAGAIRTFHSQDGISVAQAECTTAYPGVTMTRTLVLTPDYLVDVFHIVGEESHTYDWAYHAPGEIVPSIPASPLHGPLGKTNGYQHVKNVHTGVTDATWHTDFLQSNGSVRVTMLGPVETTVFLGQGTANTGCSHTAVRTLRPYPMLLARRTGTEATFVAVIEAYTKEPDVTRARNIDVTGHNASALQLEHRNGQTHTLMVAESGGPRRTFSGIDSNSRVCYARAVGTNVLCEIHID